jgi:hypothetical protein
LQAAAEAAVSSAVAVVLVDTEHRQALLVAADQQKAHYQFQVELHLQLQ